MPSSDPAGSGPVRLTVDEGALVVGLLDYVIDGAPLDEEVRGVASRTRVRVANALSAAVGTSPERPAGTSTNGAPSARYQELRDTFLGLQAEHRELSVRVERTTEAAVELRRVVRKTRSLLGDEGDVFLAAADPRLQDLRADLVRVVAA